MKSRTEGNCISDPRVQIILRALDTQPSLRVSELAGLVNLSKSRVEHLVQSELGVNIRAYKRHSRLLEARRLLSSSMLTIKEIRYKCGINDASNFNRLFKRQFGVSPTAFRMRLQESALTAPSTNK